MGDESGDPVDGWASLGLDPRLLRALTKKRYRAPTAVQSQAIPLVLEGKDVVARAHTGSGKTAAYLLPAIHKIVTADDLSSGGAPLPNPRVLVLVPTRELAHQVKKEAAFLLGKCAPSLRAGELPAAGCASVVLREFAGAPPEILIATPARAAECVRESLFPPNALAGGLELLVLDEADLLLSFGYEDDIKFVFEKCRVGTQCMLLSATSGDNDENLARLESLVLQRPVRLEVSSGVGAGADAENENGEGDGNKNKNGPDVAHRTIRTPQKDKLLVTMALLRLGLCKRKTLVFVKDPDAAVKLRLFLDKVRIAHFPNPDTVYCPWTTT
jgi:ATP-dependent RNA helicase DDX56/DBP9